VQREGNSGDGGGSASSSTTPSSLGGGETAPHGPRVRVSDSA
jgi:hypothetical protein